MQNKILSNISKDPLNNLNNYTPMLYKGSMIPLSVLIPRVKKNKIFYENGLSRIIPRLQLKVISDIEICKELWEKFRYRESLFDLWDIRESLWQAYQYPLYFYTVFEDSNPVGMLPLQYDTDDNIFNWFGGEYTEDNKFFIHDSWIINILLKILPKPVKMRGIIPVEEEDLYVNPFEKDDAKNIKYLTSFSSVYDYIAGLHKKTRYNFKRDIKHIESLHPTITIEEPNLDLADEMIGLMRVRFADDEKNKEWLFDPRLVQTFRYIVTNMGLYKVKFIRVIIDDKLAGLDMLLSYKDTVYSLGANASHIFSGAGNYMTYLNVKYAIEQGFQKLDYFQEDYGYKHRYFDQYPAWKIVVK